MIGRQPDGGIVNVRETPSQNTAVWNSLTTFVPANTWPTVDARPLWDTTPLPTAAPTCEDYKEACRKIRALADSNKSIGPWSSWKVILDLLPKE